MFGSVPSEASEDHSTSSSTTAVRAAVVLTVLVVLTLVVHRVGGLDALKASGLMSTVPPGGGLFKQLIHTMQMDADWLIATGIGLALTMIGGLLVFGSQRAPDHFFRIASGIAVILIVAPAIMA